MKEKGRINYSDSAMLEHLIQQEKDREIYHKDEGMIDEDLFLPDITSPSILRTTRANILYEIPLN